MNGLSAVMDKPLWFNHTAAEGMVLPRGTRLSRFCVVIVIYSGVLNRRLVSLARIGRN